MHSAPAKPLWFYFAGLLPIVMLFGAIWAISDFGPEEAAVCALILGLPMPALALFSWATWLTFLPAGAMSGEMRRGWHNGLRSMETMAMLPMIVLSGFLAFLFVDRLAGWPTSFWDTDHDRWRGGLLVSAQAFAALGLHLTVLRRCLVERLEGSRTSLGKGHRMASVCSCLLAGSTWGVFLVLLGSGGEGAANLAWACSAGCAGLACALLFSTALISHAWGHHPASHQQATAAALMVQAMRWVLAPLLGIHVGLQLIEKLGNIRGGMTPLENLTEEPHRSLGFSFAGLTLAAWWWWIPRQMSQRANHSAPEALSTLTRASVWSGMAALAAYYLCQPPWFFN